jgi:hypothetical protein
LFVRTTTPSPSAVCRSVKMRESRMLTFRHRRPIARPRSRKQDRKQHQDKPDNKQRDLVSADLANRSTQVSEPESITINEANDAG